MSFTDSKTPETQQQQQPSKVDLLWTNFVNTARQKLTVDEQEEIWAKLTRFDEIKTQAIKSNIDASAKALREAIEHIKSLQYQIDSLKTQLKGKNAEIEDLKLRHYTTTTATTDVTFNPPLSAFTRAFI